MSFFIGYLTKPRPDFEQYLGEPKVPKNYKDPRTIAEHQERAKNEQRAEAGRLPLTAEVAHVTVFNLEGDLVIDYKSDENVRAGVGFLDWLLTRSGLDFDYRLSAEPTRGKYLFGFEIKNFMRIVGLECLKESKPDFPPRVWYHNPYLMDPVDIILGTQGERDRISPFAMAAYFGIPFNTDTFADTHKQALLVRDLVKAANLLRNG